MFPRRYYAGRMFAARYFPQSQGTAPAAVEIGRFTLTATRVTTITTDVRRVVTITTETR
jgi:hypothetical protein